VSSFHFSSHFIVVSIHSIIARLLYIMFHPVFVSLTSGNSLILFTIPADLAVTHNIDVFALTETWISPNTTSAQLFDAIPRGFTFINTPRSVPNSCTSSIVANFSPHLPLLLNPLNCLQSQSNFLTLIWLYITSIVLLNLLPNVGILCLSLSF